MKVFACLVCLTLISLNSPRSYCQERGGSVRVRVWDERGTPQPVETPVYTDSHALLVGNSAYSDSAWSDLPEVDDDLAAVKAVLERQHGFKVEVAINRNRDALLKLIDQFISRHGQRHNNRLLIYYSGHGYTALLPDERRMGYLVMPDAPAMPPEERALRTPPSEEEFERFLPSAITMDEVETYARRITARHALFVFDSCFAGTMLYKDLGVGVPRQITTEELKPVRAYLTAGNETQRVPAFSKFRHKFVAALSGAADANGDGYILGSELGRWVSIEVEKETSRRQTPIFGKDELFRRGDMIFVSPQGAAPTPPMAATPSPPAALQRNAEQLFWQEVEKRNTATGYRTYLSTYPQGEYAGVAQLRIENLAWEGFKGLAQSLMKYSSIGPFWNDRALVSANGKYGFIDRSGREAVPLKYGNAARFSEGLAWVWSDGKWGIIDKAGNYVVAPKYGAERWIVPSSFSEGVAFILSGYKIGFVDNMGREITPFIYDGAGPFRDGFAQVSVSVGGIWNSGYINKLGQSAVPPPSYTPQWLEGPALMLAQGKYGFVDKTGKEVIAFKYDSADQFTGGIASVWLGGKVGMVDLTGKEIVAPRYDEIWCKGFLGDGFAGVTLGGRKGFVDIYGNEYFDLR